MEEVMQVAIEATDEINSSILTTIIGMLGPYETYENFAAEIRVHINTELGVLSQLGIGTKDFRITGTGETWADFLGDQAQYLSMALDYVYLRVKAIFDTQNSSLIGILNEKADELAWRLRTRIEDESLD